MYPVYICIFLHESAYDHITYISWAILCAYLSQVFNSVSPFFQFCLSPFLTLISSALICSSPKIPSLNSISPAQWAQKHLTILLFQMAFSNFGQRSSPLAAVRRLIHPSTPTFIWHLWHPFIAAITNSHSYLPRIKLLLLLFGHYLIWLTNPLFSRPYKKFFN